MFLPISIQISLIENQKEHKFMLRLIYSKSIHCTKKKKLSINLCFPFFLPFLLYLGLIKIYETTVNKKFMYLCLFSISFIMAYIHNIKYIQKLKLIFFYFLRYKLSRILFIWLLLLLLLLLLYYCLSFYVFMEALNNLTACESLHKFLR